MDSTSMTEPVRFRELEETIVRWLGETATGDEYGGTFVLPKVLLAEFWGVLVRGGAQREPTHILEEADTLQARAALLARAMPAVAIDRPEVPRLTGDVLEDTRRVTGLTLDEIGRAVGVSGRAVAGWRATDVPRHRQEFLRALRSIGLSLVGGLGPQGVRRWFLMGRPSRLERLATGDVEGVASDARRYETSPAT